MAASDRSDWAPSPSRSGNRMACVTMVFKLALSAQERWRTLSGAELLKDVINGEAFEDSVRKQAA